MGGVRRIGGQDGKRPLSYSEDIGLGRLILDVNLAHLGRENLGESIASDCPVSTYVGHFIDCQLIEEDPALLFS